NSFVSLDSDSLQIANEPPILDAQLKAACIDDGALRQTSSCVANKSCSRNYSHYDQWRSVIVWRTTTAHALPRVCGLSRVSYFRCRPHPREVAMKRFCAVALTVVAGFSWPCIGN